MHIIFWIIIIFEHFRVNDYNSRSVYIIDNGLFIERGGLGRITTKFGKMIIRFETGTVFVTKSWKKRLTRRVALFFPDTNIIFMLLKEHLNIH
jgi:hypothetical protein